MRYFKYRNTSKTLNIALKEQYKNLTQDQQRTARRMKAWSNFTLTVIFTLLIGFCIVISYLLKQIPRPDGGFVEFLVEFGIVLLGILLFCLACILIVFLTKPLINKVESYPLPTATKAILSKSCKHLREYYQLEEPYIITKCFASSNENFNNHDICLFIVGDELRLTTDLVRGFLHGERDLGCYALKAAEITLIKHQHEAQLRVELKANEVAFLLGYRAKSFIEKNFLTRKIDT